MGTTNNSASLLCGLQPAGFELFGQIHAERRVCGELLVKRRPGDGIGLGSDSASGKNADLQPVIVASGLLR